MAIKCKCGGELKKSKIKVEFFGIDFGLRDGEVCRSCGAEYIDQEVMEEVELEVKNRGGLERKVQIGKSGNSLILRIPVDIAKYLNLHHKSLVQLFPINKDRLEVEIIG